MIRQSNYGDWISSEEDTKLKKLNYQLTFAFVFICLAASFCLAQDPVAQDPKPVASPDAPAVKTTSEPEKPRDSGLIYFYRIKQYTGSALEPSVYCDDKELARMDNGRYFGVTLEPGKHICSMGDKQTGFEIDVKPGEQYYARVTIDVGFWKGRGRLTLMQKEQAGFELKKVKPLGADKVKNRSLVTVFEGSESNQ